MILAIDYGRRHVGLALGDEETKVASPYKTLRRETDEQVFAELAVIAKREGVTALIVGLPQTTNGSDGDMTREAAEFGAGAARATGFPLAMVDERFTSQGAQALRRQESGADEHALAAMLILQTFLEQQESKS